MLFVLDNFEQIVSAAPILVQLYTIAPDADVPRHQPRRAARARRAGVRRRAARDPRPGVARLARTGADAPAVELFAERASAANPAFELTDENLPAVVGICRVLDGVPLAIELAAARTRVLTPADILRRLDRQLALLVDSSRDLPERQRTLRSTIEWSAGLLDDASRRLLSSSPCSRRGSRSIRSKRWRRLREWDFDVFEALETLVDSSLVDQSDVDGEPSFSLLVSVREYGVELLAAAGEEDAVRDAHAAVYTAVARTQADHLGTGDQLAAVARLRLERGNLRAAVRHMVTRADAETACDVAWRLFVFWWVGGYLMEVAVWLEEMLERTGGAASPRVHAIVALLRGVARRVDDAPAGDRRDAPRGGEGVRGRRRPARRRDGDHDGGGGRDQQRGTRCRGGHGLAARGRGGVPGGAMQGGASASRTSRWDGSRCSAAGSTTRPQLFQPRRRGIAGIAASDSRAPSRFTMSGG